MKRSKSELIQEIQKLNPDQRNLQNKTLEDLLRLLEETQREEIEKLENRKAERRRQAVLSGVPGIKLPDYTALRELSLWQTLHQRVIVADYFELLEAALETLRAFQIYEFLKSHPVINDAAVQQSDISDAFGNLKKAIDGLPLISPELPEGLVSGILSYLKDQEDPE